MITRIRDWDSHKSIERSLWTLLSAVFCLLYFESSDHPEMVRRVALILAIMFGIASIVITFTRVSQEDKKEKRDQESRD